VLKEICERRGFKTKINLMRRKPTQEGLPQQQIFPEKWFRSEVQRQGSPHTKAQRKQIMDLAFCNTISSISA